MAITDTDYVATYGLTDKCDSSTVLPTDGAMFQTGLYQEHLYDWLSTYITNFNATLTALDGDTGGAGTDTDYNTTCVLSAIGNAGYKIFDNGMHQADFATLLKALETNFELFTAKLDADTGVTDTDYTGQDFDLDATLISALGIKSQGDVVTYLNTVTTKFNALLGKMDAD